MDIERPPGRKAEKDRKKRKSKDMENDSTGLCVNLLQEMREEKRQFNEKNCNYLRRHMFKDKRDLLLSKKSHDYNK